MDSKELREQTIKDAKCGLILDAASKIFSEKGYLNTRLEDIADAAGFSKPSLYTYYPDKEAIFLSLAIRELGKALEKTDAVTDSHGPFNETLEAMLHILFTNFSQIFSFLMTASSFTRLQVVGAEIMTKHNDLMFKLHESFNHIIVSIEKIITRGRTNGEISSTLDSRSLALFIFSLIHGTQMQSWMTGTLCDIDAVVKNIVDFVKQGVGVRKV